MTPNDSGMDPATYIEGLKAELDNEMRAGRKDRVTAIKAELDRVSGKKVEKAVKADDTEKAAAPKAAAPKTSK